MTSLPKVLGSVILDSPYFLPSKHHGLNELRPGRTNASVYSKWWPIVHYKLSKDGYDSLRVFIIASIRNATTSREPTSISFVLHSTPALTCLSVPMGLVGWNSSQGHSEHVEATKILSRVDDISVVYPVDGQYCGGSIFSKQKSMPVAVGNVHFRDVSLHLPRDPGIWCEMYFAVLNL